MENDLPEKLASPAQRALVNAGIKNLAQLAKFSETQVKEYHGIGPNALITLRAALKDPKKLFNAGLEAKATRAIDISEGEKMDEAALKDLIRQAVDLNSAGKKK